MRKGTALALGHFCRCDHELSHESHPLSSACNLGIESAICVVTAGCYLHAGQSQDASHLLAWPESGSQRLRYVHVRKPPTVPTKQGSGWVVAAELAQGAVAVAFPSHPS